jgi:hypothetical protein
MIMRNPHRRIISELHPQAVGDLLRTPRAGPAAVLLAIVEYVG